MLRIKYCVGLMLIASVQVNSYASPLSSFPIKPGEVGPIANDQSGRPQQYPFICRSKEAGLGNPMIDNHQEIGTPVMDDTGKILGYSENCGIGMRIDYFYKPKQKNILLPLPRDSKGQYYYPKDVAHTAVGTKYIVRIERGTLNRFIYMIAILEDIVANKTPQQSGYKNRATFNFGGGTGIGYAQASPSAAKIIADPSKLLDPADPITLGYAELFSTGTVSSTHYNLNLGLVTAQMVKQQFIAEFGAPRFTIGFGGSGGAVQQYVYSQQDPSLLDGIIPFAAFPDMITRTNYVSDCALLEYYFDNLAYDAPTPWNKRELIEGLHASANMPASELGLANPKTIPIRHDKLGSDTCINGWGGVPAHRLNPYTQDIPDIGKIKITHPIRWTLWDDESAAIQFGRYPVDQNYLTENTISNEGVQKGYLFLETMFGMA